jgi:protein SCO1
MALGRFRRFAVLAMVGAMALGGRAWAQGLNDAKPMGAAAQGGLPSYLKNAGLEQRLNQPLPLTTTFLDETGRQVALGTYFHERPVAMAMVYFKCGMLCPQVLHGMAEGLKASGFTAGKDYDVVVASIDPTDTPADAMAAKKVFLNEAGMNTASSGAAVHFLTGQEVSIAALSGAAGFHYVRVPGPDGKMDQFAHSSVIMFATPDGKMSKYLAGVEFPSRDVRLALVDASQHRIGTAKDMFLLYCCNYVPSVGRYTVDVLRLLGMAAMVTLVGMGAGIYLLTRKRVMPGAV